MNKKLLIGVLVITILFVAYNLWKNRAVPVYLSDNNNGGTVVVAINQPIIVRLNFGGGLFFSDAKYDPTILNFKDHFFTAPPDITNKYGETSVGGIGTDTFEFVPTQKGSTYIELDTPPNNPLSNVPDIAFKILVVVK